MAITAMASEKLEIVSRNLGEARQTLVALVALYADKSEYGSSQSAMQLAQQLDGMKNAVAELVRGESKGRESQMAHAPTNMKGPFSFPMQTRDLPFFYAEDGKLVMRGPSRDGGYYEQRIPKRHYDLIVSKLRSCQQKGDIVRNQSLLNRAEMPVHEPGIILKLLESKGVLVILQKGVYSFATAGDVVMASQAVWDDLPRASTGTFR